MSSFKIKQCLEKQGYKVLTELQKKAFDLIVNKAYSLIIVAPTGSGKTEAALFPIMYLIYKNKFKPVSTIYITPLRALNRDIVERIERIGSCFGITVALRHGDTPQSRRKIIVSNPPDILVTTPETFNYLLLNEKFRRYLKNLRFIVIDEFRELLESKRGYLLFTVIYLLEKYVLKKRTRKIALTATLKDSIKASQILDSGFFGNVFVLSGSDIKKLEIEIKVPDEKQAYKYGLGKIINDIKLASRLAYIIDMINKHSGVLIFVNTRSMAERLGYLLSKVIEFLDLEDLEIGVHHGSLSKQHRLSMEHEFKYGALKGLIATSSMELGIDIGKINYVIQYMSPRQVTRLLQRIGRSGHRLGRVSRGSIIVHDNLFQILESIVLTRRALAYDLELEKIENSPLDTLAYSITLLSMIVNGLDKYDFYHKIIDYVLYRDLDISVYEKLLEYLEYSRIIKIENNIVKPAPRARLYLYKVTMIPDTRNIEVVNIYDGKKIGILNEEYVVININPNDTIVLGGKTWKVIEYDHEDAKLFVEPVMIEKETVIPHWEGESIPVEYRVAREIGSVIRRLKERDKKVYEVYSFAKNILETCGRKASLFGDDKTIIIDYNNDLNLLTINVYGGSLVNKFLRDLLKTVISRRFPFLNVQIYSTPYAIFISITYRQQYNVVEQLINTIEDVFHNLTKYIDLEIVKEIAKEQNTLYWRIYQVAQRFGAIDPSQGPISKNILAGFIDSIIGYEAFKEVVFKDYDLEDVKILAEMIRKGKVKIVKRYTSIPDQFHVELLNYVEIPSTDTLKPMDKEIYRERVLNRRITLICIRCGYLLQGRIHDFLGRKYYCPNCGLKTLAVIKTDGKREKEIILKLQQGKKLKDEEKKIIEDLRRRTILLIEHGEKALIALGARGVGSKDVSKIISRLSNGEDLYDVLYEYEKKAIRARKYSKKKQKLSK